jgi:predicted NUDIX family phosphoesterase
MQSKILAKGPFEPQNIKITVTENNRRTNPEIESMIETTWEEVSLKAKNENQMLWNGLSLSLNDLEVNGDQLTLMTCVVEFKQRVGISRNFNRIEHLGKEYFDMGMAVGCIIETGDNNFIFINRSSRSVNMNRTDLVGGVMDRIDATCGNDLIAHGYQEIKEEINLDQADIKSMSILGIVMAPTSNVIVIMDVKVDCSLEEILLKFELGHDDEADSLKIVPASELKDFLITLGGYKPSVVKLLDLSQI